MADVLKKTLKSLADLSFAFVYGSFASGEMGPKSDVDLFMIGNVPLPVLTRAVRTAESKLGREVQYSIFDGEEFLRKLKKGDDFIRQVVLGHKIMIVGDDLTVTNISRIKTALEKKAINSVIIKPNQIGSLTETLESIALAIQNGIVPIVSHRSGETLDSFIADLAVGLGCPYFKSGSLVQPERMSKYQRLVEIENILQKK